MTAAALIEIEIGSLKNLIEIAHRVQGLCRSCRYKFEGAIGLSPKSARIPLVMNNGNCDVIGQNLEALSLQDIGLIERVKQADHGKPMRNS